jgi:hypothetical protein
MDGISTASLFLCFPLLQIMHYLQPKLTSKPHSSIKENPNHPHPRTEPAPTARFHLGRRPASTRICEKNGAATSQGVGDEKYGAEGV